MGYCFDLASCAQILDLWLIAHRAPKLERLFIAVPTCAIAGYANSLVTSALWAREGPVMRIETSIANFDPQARPCTDPDPRVLASHALG